MVGLARGKSEAAPSIAVRRIEARRFLQRRDGRGEFTFSNEQIALLSQQGGVMRMGRQKLCVERLCFLQSAGLPVEVGEQYCDLRTLWFDGMKRFQGRDGIAGFAFGALYCGELREQGRVLRAAGQRFTDDRFSFRIAFCCDQEVGQARAGLRCLRAAGRVGRECTPLVLVRGICVCFARGDLGSEQCV